MPRSITWGRILAAGLLASVSACAWLYPAQRVRVVHLTPRPLSSEYVEIPGGIEYHNDGLRVRVEHLDDAQLNRLFPQESSLGEYSINPYTYGDWVDPDVGHTPIRFTVFRVTVDNGSFAQVQLDPLSTRLVSDRGDVLPAYGILAGSNPRNFESYYRARRGPSGNEFYRFNMRMGIVQSNNYSVDERVFKGENYEGLIVFDALDEEVSRVRLLLQDFVLRFTAYGDPLETVNLTFSFDHRVEEAQRASVVDRAQSATRVRLAGPCQIEGDSHGDSTRSASAVERVVSSRLGEARSCFEGPFLDGRAAEGKVATALRLDASGAVIEARILSSDVWASDVDDCLQRRMSHWQFSAAASASTQVTASCVFDFIDARP